MFSTMFAQKPVADNKGDNIVIVGLGPAGLAAAITACRNDTHGRKVIAFMDRQEYTRNQIFRLDASTLHYLYNLVGDEEYSRLLRNKKLESISDAAGTKYYLIQIKALEETLLAALKKYDNQIDIIHTGKETDIYITSIDTDSQSIVLSNGKNIRLKRIPFKYLIATDGAHHSMSNLLNQKSPIIKYDQTQQPMMHQSHVIANFSMPKNSLKQYKTELSSKAKDFNPNILSLQSMGWEHHSCPETRIFMVDNTLYIGAECPDKLDTDPKILESWMREVLKFYLSDDYLSKLKLQESKGNIAKFKVELDEATQTLVPIMPKSISHLDDSTFDHCSFFFNIGDSLRKPHYHTGSGVVIAFSQCQALRKFLGSAQTPDDLMQYHYEVAFIRQENRERIDKHLSARAAREQSVSQGNKDAGPKLWGF